MRNRSIGIQSALWYHQHLFGERKKVIKYKIDLKK